VNNRWPSSLRTLSPVLTKSCVARVFGPDAAKAIVPRVFRPLMGSSGMVALFHRSFTVGSP